MYVKKKKKKKKKKEKKKKKKKRKKKKPLSLDYMPRTYQSPQFFFRSNDFAARSGTP